MLDIHEKYLKKMSNEIAIRGLSRQTRDSYVANLREYFLFVGDPEKFEFERIKEFLSYKKAKNISGSTLNLYLSAIKYFYRHVMHIEPDIPLKFSKRPRKLPIVLTHGEIFRIAEEVSNFKHRTIILLAYGAGLRVSEVVNLKVQDIDFERGLIYICEGKGQKDRYTLLPKKLEYELKKICYLKSRPDYVFESVRGGKLSQRTPQVVFKRALHAAKLQKNATFHSLRHSFATHMIENGVNLRFVQDLLGHVNVTTTMRYTHVSKASIQNLNSPL